MDVNLTISLIRGQMGTVIEKAVAVAVETVLGEMMKVVSIKFDEFRKEMHAKDKENENIRQMLEISRCQMKAMRKYMSVPSAKADRPSQAMQRQQVNVNQFDSTRVPETYVEQYTSSQPLSQGRVSNGLLCRRTVNNHTSSEVRNRDYVRRPPLSQEANNPALHNTKDPTTERLSTEHPTQSDVRLPTQSEVRLIASDGTTFLTPIKQEIADSQEPDCSLQEVGESDDAAHSRRQDQSGSSDSTDSQLLSPVQLEEEPPAPPLSRPAPALKEEGEKEEVVEEVLSIKQEPYEVEVEVENDSLLGGLEDGLHPDGEIPNPGGYLEGTGTQQITAAYYPSLASTSSYASQSCLPMNSVSTVTASASSSSLTSPGSGSGVGPSAGVASAVVRQVAGRPWLRDLNLYEQYKQARSELRRRNQLRRKQVEQDLPQALLADLVKERREKTRLRVARWRAKRKLQACLMNAQQQSPGAVTAAVAAAAAASAAAAQAGLSERRMTSGMRMQMGVAGQQQRLGRQTQQQHQQQGRVGLPFGGRVGRAYPPFGAGTQHGGLPAVNVASGQTYGAGGRFAPQRGTTYTQGGSQGADAGMYQ